MIKDLTTYWDNIPVNEQKDSFLEALCTTASTYSAIARRHCASTENVLLNSARNEVH